jgi:hypothetical protein
MSTQERLRGRQDAKSCYGSEKGTVEVKQEDLRKLTVLLDNFLDANSNTKITSIDNVPFGRHAVIRYLDDIAYVLGFLEGLQ